MKPDQVDQVLLGRALSHLINIGKATLSFKEESTVSERVVYSLERAARPSSGSVG